MRSDPAQALHGRESSHFEHLRRHGLDSVRGAVISATRSSGWNLGRPSGPPSTLSSTSGYYCGDRQESSNWSRYC